MFRHAGTTDPSLITVPQIARFITSTVGPSQRTANQYPANNTVHKRMATVRTFLTFCARRGIPVCDFDDALRTIGKSHPVTYGKQQDKYPARFLTRGEAFDALVTACQDGTWKGSRDQLAIRMGLMGIRVAEILNMQIRHIDGAHLRWNGKGNRPRMIKMGPTFQKHLAKWLKVYEQQLGRPLKRTDPIICRAKEAQPKSYPAQDPRWIEWGRQMRAQTSFRALLTKRATIAGLGHISPHDLRRSAAAIMHNERSSDGGHRFDLGDIQHVLGHANPSTTEASYLNHLDNDAQERAGDLLD